MGLFPDWCRVDAAGRFSAGAGQRQQFGWEAVRLPFRVALDGFWFSEPRAAQLLKDKFLPFFKANGRSTGELAAVYDFRRRPGGGL